MSDLLLDAVRAEVAYRVGELQKTRGTGGRPRANRAVRWLRAHRLTGVAVPAQERREAVRASSDARAR
ncbi:hypothetical protein [Amycolatopsis saalfeldensis]|uniref:Uncharacterized protein n=1 Tax=Amycolatopsis saalfeldensis TaxID=394193 RepID=A0A1H8X3H9_9PSEU|nr:hypothetical protein [Amycolatopsis saalfeldensis]SEP34495.1 hypothetical protein SAMN04489732_106241 [Amycolatopsis saalfeldensis]